LEKECVFVYDEHSLSQSELSVVAIELGPPPACTDGEYCDCVGENMA
jgi:hypothetical protein